MRRVILACFVLAAVPLIAYAFQTGTTVAFRTKYAPQAHPHTRYEMIFDLKAIEQPGAEVKIAELYFPSVEGDFVFNQYTYVTVGYPRQKGPTFREITIKFKESMKAGAKSKILQMTTTFVIDVNNTFINLDGSGATLYSNSYVEE